MTPKQQIAAIYSMTPAKLLYIWRFEPSGSPWHTGEVGARLST